MGLMFTNNPLGHDFNEPMVDRLLGKAYQTIKEVHENLSEITNAVAVTEDNKQVKESIEKLNSLLESFETGAGLFLGHDLGEVGEENDPNTYIGDNSLSAIAKSAEHLETVSNNIDTLNLLSIHINELKAIAEALEDILNIQSSVETVEKITDYIDDIKKVSVNVGTITTVNSSLDDIKKLADNVETFPEIINSTDDIIKVAKYISSIVTCASNVATYLEANKNLKNAQEILEDGSIKKVADIAEPVQTVANNISSINKVAENIDNIGDSSALEPRVEALENTSASYETRIKANETAKVDHDSRITTNTADISTLNSKVSSVETTLTTQATTLADHTKRLDSMETASDVGQFATRLQAIEDKNTEQDAKDEELETSITNLPDKYVTLDTAQTLTGKKTLSTTNKSVVTRIIITNNDNTVTPTENVWTNAITATDKNNKGIGSLQFNRLIDGSNQLNLQAVNQNANGNDISVGLSVALKSNGTSVAKAPNTPSNAVSTEIATAKFVTDKITPINTALSQEVTDRTKAISDLKTSLASDYVTLGTQQNISGLKVFNRSSNGVVFKEPNMDVTTTPSSDVINKLLWQDKNAKNVGWVKATHNTANQHVMELTAVAINSSNKEVYGAINVSVKPDGTVKTNAPNPASNSNDTSIATTAWVKTKLASITSQSQSSIDLCGWFPMFNTTADTRCTGVRHEVSKVQATYTWTAPANCWVVVEGKGGTTSGKDCSLYAAVSHGVEAMFAGSGSNKGDNVYCYGNCFMPKGSVLKVTMNTLSWVYFAHTAIYESAGTRPASDTPEE